MPIYEYELKEGQCSLCPGRFEHLQSVDEEALDECPTCYRSVRRLISRASFAMDKSVSADQAATHGFSTYKRVGDGQYEKIAGDGGPSALGADDV